MKGTVQGSAAIRETQLAGEAQRRRLIAPSLWTTAVRGRDGLGAMGFRARRRRQKAQAI